MYFSYLVDLNAAGIKDLDAVFETYDQVGSNYPMDFLSNGFKMRATDGATNGSGRRYIYMAFAESPFVSSEGIPTTAR